MTTHSRRHRRARRGRRRTTVLVTAGVVVVVALGVGGFVFLAQHGGGGGDDEPTRNVATDADRTPTTSTTLPPTTTTTLVASPDRIVPPKTPEATAATLVRVERAIRGDDRDPDRLRVLGWEQQLAYRELSNHEDWIPPMLAALPEDVRPWVQRNLDASAALSRLTPAQTQFPDWSILVPPPPETMRDYYAEAEQASGIPWIYLAAIHFLETRMGRIRGNSDAGAQGPMQFIPSSWAAYGNGGNVNDNRDSILAAGRYLKAAGGSTDIDKAIFAYNHDNGYVTAVKSYAQNLLEHPRAYDGYYQWQVYYRTVDGTFLLPEGWRLGGPVVPQTLPPT